MKYQKGYLSGKGWTGFLVLLTLISAIIGWGVIESILWILSHITIGWI